ncbi:MAG: ABC transporter ATP-binding protein/permease [Planctomycetes bacterium]|nr:ABC transporter ATP-binding protein/permease [Planctomycetota bacterium]
MTQLLRLLRTLRPYAGSVVLALVLSFLVAGLTSLSLSTLIPILETLFTDTGLAEVQGHAERALAMVSEDLARFVVDHLLDTRMAVLQALLVTVLVITVLKGLLRFFDEYIVGKVSVAAGRDLTALLFARLTRQSPLFVEREGVGNISARFAADGDQVIRGLRTVTGTFLREPLQFVFLLLLALLISPLLTVASLLIFPLIGLLIRQAGRVARRHAKQVLVHRASLLSIVQDVFFSIRLVQSCRAEDRAQARFEGENRLLFDRERRLARAEAVSSPVIEVLVVVGVGATLLLGGAMAIRGEISASRLVTLYVAVGALYEPVRKVAAAIPRIQACLAASTRIHAFVDREPEVRDAPGATPLPPLTREIRLENVSVTYGGRAKALVDVDLRIPAGSFTALVGPSGSGKSTLVALLPRLLDPEQGGILFDGVDLRAATLDSVRSRVLLVSQDPLILNESVRENVALARPRATEEEIADALRAARVSEFSDRLSAGLDTVTGERGTTLSGGQRQRVALARAILADPDVLILDEAFSQIDEDQANAVLAEIRARRANRTTILITHRVEAVAGAEKIVVLERGQLVAHGRHEALLNGCGVYRDLLAAAEAARTGGGNDRKRPA